MYALLIDSVGLLAVILAFGLMLLWRHCNRVRWM